MVMRTVSCRFAEKSLSVASEFHKARTCVPFIESVKQRHRTRLEALDRQLEEADQSRKSICNSSTVDILHHLSEKVLSGNSRFVQVGSSVNGLSSGNSDIDLVFFPTDVTRRSSFMKDFHGNGDFKMTFITVMSKLITREVEKIGISVKSSVVLHQLRIDSRLSTISPTKEALCDTINQREDASISMRMVKFVFASQVPLLIIQLENGQSIDIQFPNENFQAIRNSNLIRHYVQCDHRLQRLFLYFRTLLDALEIRNSKYGLLSSYHILLLIIHFLQSEQSLSPWPVLPVLCKTHGNLVGAQILIDNVVSMLENPLQPIEWCSHNHMTAAELILRFVDYYAAFDASHHVIHIDKGLTTRRKQVSGDVRLLVIDPYCKSTVCRSSAAARAFSDSMTYLKRKMANGYFLDTFPTFPEASLFTTQTKWLPWRQHVRDKKVIVDKRTVDHMERVEINQEL